MLALRMTAALLAVAGWLAVLQGLRSTPRPFDSRDPATDFDAGARLGANVDVYGPSILLTLFFLVILVSFRPRPHFGASLVVSLTTMAFAAWVASRGYLTYHLPELSAHLLVSVALAVTGASIAAIAWAESGSKHPEPVVQHAE